MKYYANHVYKTELTIGSYYDLSIKKIGNLSKNPFILFYVMMVGTSVSISYNPIVFFRSRV
jgi:hypothetical protein